MERRRNGARGGRSRRRDRGRRPSLGDRALNHPPRLLRLECGDAEATHRVGSRLGRLVGGAQVLSLEGPLGSGKTWLAGGIGRGLGLPPDTRVTSPTYALLNVHDHDAARLVLYHMDLYRLGDVPSAALFALGIAEHLASPPQDGVTVVEWLDQRPDIAPTGFLRVRIDGVGDSPRALTLEVVGDDGDRSLTLFRTLARAVAGGEMPPSSGDGREGAW